MFFSSQWAGALYAAAIFVFCFLSVHVIKLAAIGYRARKNLPHEKKEEPEKKEEEKEPAEPVYYIVEKKKKRAKAAYSEPKRISFHEEKS